MDEGYGKINHKNEFSDSRNPIFDALEGIICLTPSGASWVEEKTKQRTWKVNRQSFLYFYLVAVGSNVSSSLLSKKGTECVNL